MKKIKIRGIDFVIKKLSRADLKDVKKFLRYINALIKEEAQILFNRPLSLKDEKEWINEELLLMKKKRQIVLVARAGNDIAGICNLKLEPQRRNHTASLGITIAKNYRSLGLGKILIKELIKLARYELRPRPKFIRLWCFETNKIAQRLYRKMGFKIVARIPHQLQYQGRLVGEIIMLKRV